MESIRHSFSEVAIVSRKERKQKSKNQVMSKQRSYFVLLVVGFCWLIEGTVTSGERPATLLVSNAVDKASTIEQPAISSPDEYKAHFIKQGKRLG